MPTPAARWFDRLQFVIFCLGLLLIAATVSFPLHFWTTELSTPWGEGNGGVLIVLAGDAVAPDMFGATSYWRSVYAVREWRTGRYGRIIVTGKGTAPLMRDFIAGQGVPREFIQVEDAATSTHENALYVAQLLRGDVNPKVLLTSDFHMRRALGAFLKAGVAVKPLAIPDAHKRLGDWTQRWGVFCTLLEETGKLVYYKAHGWA